MCAINGIITFHPSSDTDLRRKIDLMQRVTKHRGPDESDTTVEDGTALGTNRLAVVDPKHTTTLSKEVGPLFVLFNGEIVNFRTLRTELPAPYTGTDSDTAVILPLFRKFGPDFVKKLAGMFAIAVYDRQRHTLRLWRDPMGIKPLYYYHSADEIIFSSEIKAIYAVMDHEPAINFAALDHILTHRFQPGRDTVFPEIKRVLPGESIVFDETGERHERYWTLGNNSQTPDPDATPEAFRTLLEDVMNEYTGADVPGGLFTSGGLDSSLITSMGLRIAGSPFRQPISLRFSPKPVIDERYAEILEHYLRTPFSWVTISDKQARETLAEIIPFLDEPLENPIHVGTYLMAKRAHELGLKTVLTGDGSDELFLGYERHAVWFTDRDPVSTYPSLCWTLNPSDAELLYSGDAKAQRMPIVDGEEQWVEPITDQKQALRFERWERLVEYHNMRLDRMTMAHGVEARVPFLDHRIVDFSLRVPLRELYGGTGKAFLKEAAKPYLPPEILDRPKILFPSLPNQWLSGDGSGWAAEILLDPTSRISAWTDRSVIERFIDEQSSGTIKRGKPLWALISMELWLRHQSEWPSVRKG